MNTEQLIENHLRHYNARRRGTESDMPAPKGIGEDIDAAITALEEHEKLKKRYDEIYSQNLEMLSVLQNFYVHGYDHETCWNIIERNGGIGFDSE